MTIVIDNTEYDIWRQIGNFLLIKSYEVTKQIHISVNSEYTINNEPIEKLVSNTLIAKKSNAAFGQHVKFL